MSEKSANSFDAHFSLIIIDSVRVAAYWRRVALFRIVARPEQSEPPAPWRHIEHGNPPDSASPPHRWRRRPLRIAERRPNIAYFAEIRKRSDRLHARTATQCVVVRLNGRTKRVGCSRGSRGTTGFDSAAVRPVPQPWPPHG